MTVGIYKQTAQDIMTKHVATIWLKETVHDALLLMAENRISALPVVDHDGRCVGMISQTDVIGITREADADDEELATAGSIVSLMAGGVQLEEITRERVEDVMSDSVVRATPDELVTSIADKMLTHQIHHVPVLAEDDILLGIISTMDILDGLRAPIVE